MKKVVFSLLFCSLSPNFFGQSPTPSPTTSESTRIKNFGSSLQKYDKKKPKGSKAQEVRPATDEDTLRIKTSLVVNDVLVLDERSNLVSGLKKDDFIVTEDGVPQTLEMFAPGENTSIPRSVVIVLDRGDTQAPYLKNSITAARKLVDDLDPNDQMAIVTSDDVRLRLDFTQDKVLLKRTLDSLEKPDPPHGSGADLSALLAVLNEMFVADEKKPIVILQGIGTEAIWLKPDNDTPFKVSYNTRYESGMKWIGEAKSMRSIGFGDVRDAVERSGTTIYSVIPSPRFLGLSDNERLARARQTLTEWIKFFKDKSDISYVLRTQQYVEAERKTAGQMALFKVAELSGGNTAFIEKPEDAQEAYAQIFTIIKNRYTLGYYPPERADREVRNVDVKVKGHPEYVITTRRNYLPQ